MKAFKFLIVLFVLSFFYISCSDSSDDSGTTGGSGETEAAASKEDSSAAVEEATKEEEEEEEEEPASVNNSSEIFLDAFKFACSGNWTDRDGALGLAAYSGSGSCETAFPGEAGNYQLILKAQTEYDGKSPYELSINGTKVAGGEFPLSSPLGCDCPHDDWRDVCPDRNTDINLGTYALNPGDIIKFWGSDEYPCGSHGSYAKWHGIEAIRR